MTGSARSGRSKAVQTSTKSDGRPEPPWPLSENAKRHYDWLCERLSVDANGTQWRRIDGATLAAASELFESQAALADALAKDPSNDKLLRHRIAFTDRVYKYSAILGLCPKDRSRIPQSNSELDDADEWSD